MRSVARARRSPYERGLPSLNEARAERLRATVGGKVRLRAMSPVFWLWAGLGIAVFAVVYWRIAAGELESQKNQVLAKRRAIEKTLGPRLLPFVSRIENWAAELARGKATEQIASDANWSLIAHRPGVYLRVRSEVASSPERLRRAASASLHDGFTSCFFIAEGSSDPRRGPACQRSADCSPGLLCNEWDVCSPPTRPYNMRLAYRAWRVLSSDFSDELREATNDLQVRAQEHEIDQVTRVDVPVAIEVLQRAQTATIVLDEPVEESVLKSVEPLEGETQEERLQRLPHVVRVGIWELPSGRRLVRWFGRAEGRLLAVGRPVRLDPDIRAAQQRQANNCALAVDLKQAIIEKGTASAEDQSSSPASSVGESEPPSSDLTKQGARGGMRDSGRSIH